MTGNYWLGLGQGTFVKEPEANWSCPDASSQGLAVDLN
jgi:hypothetical protein